MYCTSQSLLLLSSHLNGFPHFLFDDVDVVVVKPEIGMSFVKNMKIKYETN